MPGICNAFIRPLRDIEYRSLSFRSDDRNVPVGVARITSTDPRITIVRESGAAEEPGFMKLGRVGFDPSLCDGPDNYIPVCKSCKPGAAITRTELEEVNRTLTVWNRLVRGGKLEIRAQIIIESTVGSTHTIPVEAALYRPQVALQRSLQFPLTQIGNFSELSLMLVNPSRLPVVINMVGCPSLCFALYFLPCNNDPHAIIIL